MLHLFKDSVEFDSSKVLSRLGKEPVTGSAFCQARYKIDSLFFSDLCDISSEAYNSFTTTRWKGYRVLAGDGSTLNLPASKQIRGYFGVESNNPKKSLARIFLVYDINTGFTLEGKIGRMSTGEGGMLDDCLKTLPSKPADLLVLDRNFGFFNTVTTLDKQGRPFCIRMSTGITDFAKRVMKDSRMDFITEWVPTRKERETAGSSDPVLVRVSKAMLETGETELLVSSLMDMELFTTKDLVELYGKRWGVEEGIKNLKPKIKVEQFGCRKPEGIFQEFYAHVLMMNMVSLAGMAASTGIKKMTKNRKWAYKYNWKNAFRHLRASMVELFSTECAGKLLTALVDKITLSVIAIKKGRKFSRNSLGKPTRINQYYK